VPAFLTLPEFGNLTHKREESPVSIEPGRGAEDHEERELAPEMRLLSGRKTTLSADEVPK
jgi:hypothetical protein